MRGHQGVLHNLSILTAGQVVSQLANMAALVFLAGYLGPHSFGIVQIGVAFMGYALIASEWGMFSLGIREVSRLDSPREIFRYSTGHCGLLAAQAVAVLTVGLVILPQLPFFHHDAVVFLLYLAAVLPQVYTQSWVAVGLERMTWVGLSRIVRSVAYALLIFMALPLLDGLAGQGAQRWVPAILLAAMIAANLTVNIPLARLFGNVIHPRWPGWAEGRRRWQQTSSIGANTAVLRILYSIDILLLGVLASPEHVGNYAAASKIVFFLVVAVEVLWAALLPRLSRLAKESHARFRITFNLYFGIVAALLSAVALGGSLMGEDLVELIYGGRFHDAGPIFEVLAISYAALALGTFLGNTLLAEDRQRWYLLPLVLSSLVAVTAIRILTPVHGGLGTSWGMLLAHGLLLVVLVIINGRNLNALLGQTLLATVPGLVLMAVIAHVTGPWHVLWRVAAAGTAYLLVAWYPLRRLRIRSLAAATDSIAS